jgi:hypothetical protein
VSVRLIKGSGGIHLDNREHAILEHCFKDNDLTTTTLNIMLLLDVDHYEEAQAHRKRVLSGANVQVSDQEMVCFSLTVSICVCSFECSLQSLDIARSVANPTIFVERTELASTPSLESQSHHHALIRHVPVPVPSHVPYLARNENYLKTHRTHRPLDLRSVPGVITSVVPVIVLWLHLWKISDKH